MIGCRSVTGRKSALTAKATLCHSLPTIIRRTQMEPDEIALFTGMVRRFCCAEIAPHVAAWDEAGSFPLDIYRRTAELGILQLGLPEDHGGAGHPLLQTIPFREFNRVGAGGVWASLSTITIGAPIIAAAGSDELKARVLPDVAAGRKIISLAITEPSGGSDVQALTTRAVRDGDHYVINGAKTFITSAMRASWITTAVRTADAGRDSFSLIVVPADTPGLTRTPIPKMGWWASDTATLIFDNVRVPAANLVGPENAGLKLIFRNFNMERINLGAGALGAAECCLADALDWARQRQTFGKPLIGHQVIRHKLVDMQMQVNACAAVLESLFARMMAGQAPVAEISMFKNLATRCLEFCAREAMQILGGAGFVRGCNIERIYREVRVNAIGGGSEEIMKDLAARQMGW